MRMHKRVIRKSKPKPAVQPKPKPTPRQPPRPVRVIGKPDPTRVDCSYRGSITIPFDKSFRCGLFGKATEGANDARIPSCVDCQYYTNKPAPDRPPVNRDYFDRVVVINLEDRPARLAAFYDQFEDNPWPFYRPELFRAVDGRRKRVPNPPWWRAGGPAWGCFRSHHRILEDALQDDVRRLLVLEDDALMRNNGGELLFKVFAEVPAEWSMVYLGGQHQPTMRSKFPVYPIPVSDHVALPYDVNRTHAMAFTRHGMELIYDWIAGPYRPQNHHIDSHLGVLCQQRKHPIYCSTPWVFGQRAGRSDIGRGSSRHRFWNAHQP